MRFRQSCNFRIIVGPALFAAALTSALVISSGVSGNAAQGGLAYNELMKFVRSDSNPQPGSFAGDFQAAVDAQKSTANATQHHGLFGSIMNAANAAKGAMSIFQSGIASTHYYLNGWERSDDPGAQTATITRPDRHELIYLNLAKKTYRIVDTNVQPVTETPPPYQNPQSHGPQPSPEPGSGKLDISASSSVLGPKSIDNISTTGYSQNFKMSSTQSTGSCHDGTFETSIVQYVSSYAVPTAGSHVSFKYHFTAPSPQMMVTHPGCNPKTTFHNSGGASPPGDKLALWTLMTLKGSAQTDQGQMGGGFSTLIERGNVRTLGPSDSGLFEVPTDFTKEQ
jgi:hypothetical protein